MKTIINFLVLILICITLGSSIQKNSKTLILKSTDNNVSAEMLSQSAVIISGRLKTYGLKATAIATAENNEIKVQVADNINISEIGGLLVSKGNIGFYETLTLKEISGLSGMGFNAQPSEAKLGCSTFENTQVSDSVENVLRSVNLSSEYNLIWGLRNSKSLTCLYAVKIKPALTKADIESITSSKDKKSQSVAIEIRFNPASVKTWAELTKKNAGKPIAIVTDDKIFYTPVVKLPMENGFCEITGNFTQKEINYFLALANNGTLPGNLILK